MSSESLHMKARILSTRWVWILIILLFCWDTTSIKSSAEESEIIYCIGNRDATGSCRKASHDDQQDKLSCLIISWPIVECESLEEQLSDRQKYKCFALQNTGIANQISLSCQVNKNNENNNENVPVAIIDDSPDQNSDQVIEADATRERDLPVLEESKIKSNGNAFQPDLNATTFGIEQPVNFEEAF